MDKIQFEGGTKISDAKVTINGVDYIVTPAEYSGNTPLSAYILNLLQTNIEKAVVPIGGTTGQILVKKSNTDNDVEWKNSSSAINIVDNLNSSSSTDGLSARQGKVLNNKFNYSTTEKVIGTWIDSKPLYRKVVDFGTLPNTTSKAVAHNIQNLKRVVKLEGFAGSSTNRGGIPIPHATSNPVTCYASDTDIVVITTDNRTAYTETYIYIYYTKTTD